MCAVTGEFNFIQDRDDVGRWQPLIHCTDCGVSCVLSVTGNVGK